MQWSFHISEQSSGYYCVEAKRFSGESITAHGGEDAIPRILQDAYNAEMKLGTFHGHAAFHITSSFLPKWPSIYHERMFGCWTVGERDKLPSIDYDGRDFYLMVSETPDCYSWQGHIDRLAKGRSGYFEKLYTLSTKNG